MSINHDEKFCEREKDWDELTDAERIQRLIKVVKSQERSLHFMREKVDRLICQMTEHIHDQTGKSCVAIKNYLI